MSYLHEGIGESPENEDDDSSFEEVEIVGPRNPVFGRRFKVEPAVRKSPCNCGRNRPSVG